jgi:hypothetical protein
MSASPPLLGINRTSRIYEYTPYMTVARQPDVLESCFGAFNYFGAVHRDEHCVVVLLTLGLLHFRVKSPRRHVK